ncbi:hypothetical protein DFP74_1195 [Nocardiopsis sp. Huas11]|nr:hypothetical protein DFP74_1195 [Nocardiopsis sp. Huas11]
MVRFRLGGSVSGTGRPLGPRATGRSAAGPSERVVPVG